MAQWCSTPLGRQRTNGPERRRSVGPSFLNMYCKIPCRLEWFMWQDSSEYRLPGCRVGSRPDSSSYVWCYRPCEAFEYDDCLLKCLHFAQFVSGLKHWELQMCLMAASPAFSYSSVKSVIREILNGFGGAGGSLGSHLAFFESRYWKRIEVP